MVGRSSLHRQTTQHVGHNAQLHERILLSICIVLDRLVDLLLFLRLLHLTVLHLQLLRSASLFLRFVKGHLLTLELDVVQLSAEVASVLCTLNAFAVATKRACASGLSLLLCAHDASSAKSFALLNVHHVLHVGRHVALHFLSKGLRRGGSTHGLFLHRRERRDIVRRVGAVGLVRFEARNVVALHVEQLLLGRAQHCFDVWLSILRDVGVVGRTRAGRVTATTATAHTVDATMPTRFDSGCIFT